MAFTNAQLVRMWVGDPGIAAVDKFSGTGSQTEYFLTAPLVKADSQTIAVGATTYTEVAAAPGANQYTLNDESGRVVFGVAPTAGTDNIVAIYISVELSDLQIEEALRQYGLVASDTADVGATEAIINSARTGAEWLAAKYAGEFDYTADGESVSRSKVADSWAARAAALQGTIVGTTTGIQSMPVTRIDGYSEDLKGRDVQVAGTNPRRRYYGYPDRIP